MKPASVFTLMLASVIPVLLQAQNTANPAAQEKAAKQYIQHQPQHFEDYVEGGDLTGRDRDWVDEVTLAKLLEKSGYEAPKNVTFTAYHVNDIGVNEIVPIRMAIVGTDDLSLQFLRHNKVKLLTERINVIVIGDDSILRQFREAYPGIAAQNHPLDGRLIIMLGGLGVRYYPAFYEQGKVFP